jgi:hypothetical protein
LSWRPEEISGFIFVLSEMARPAKEEERAEDYVRVIRKLVCSAHAPGLVLLPPEMRIYY